MTHVKPIATPVVLLACSACTGPTKPPPYADPLQGLYNGSSQAVPADVPVSARAPVALVFSNNAELYLDYTDAAVTGYKKVPIVNAQGGRDIDPNRLADRLVAAFKTRYPGIALEEDISSASRNGAKTAFVVDIQVALGIMSGDRTKVEIGAIVFDDRPAPVSKYRGYGEGVIPYPAWDQQFGKASDIALAELERKLTAFLRDAR